MKTFKEFRETKKKPDEVKTLQTQFGSHSIPKDDRVSIIQTVFGSHSQKGVKPVVESAKVLPHPVHDEYAPLDVESLKPVEGKALKKYSDDSTVLNGMLHSNKKDRMITKTRFGDEVNTTKHLDNVLNRHKTKEDFVVYSGVKQSPAEHFKNGPRKMGIAHNPAFTSTSTDYVTAHGFANKTSHFNDDEHGMEEGKLYEHVLKIHVPKGSHAISMRKKSFLPEEDEVLIHRGYNISIHPKPEIDPGNPTTRIWNAHLTTHEPKEVKAV